MMKSQPVLYWPVSYYTFNERILDLCNMCVCVCVCVLYNSPSTPRTSKGCFWQLTFIFISPLSVVRFLPRSSQPPWFEQIIKVHIIKFSPYSCYFVPITSIFSSVLISQILQISRRMRHWILYPCKTEVKLQCSGRCFQLYVLRQTSGRERSSHKW